MPASTSSKTKVGAPADDLAWRRAEPTTVLSASIRRDNSPPEAMRSSGRRSSPGFGEIRNSTWSMPSAPPQPSSSAVKRSSKRAFSMPISASSLCASFSSFRAASRRRAESAPAACAYSDCTLSSSRRTSSSRLAGFSRLSRRGRICSWYSRSSVMSLPYFRFRRSRSARRSSISSSRRGLASANFSYLCLETASFGKPLTHFFEDRPIFRKFVEKLPLDARLEKPNVLALAVDLDQPSREFSHRIGRDRLIVRELAALAAHVRFPAEDDFGLSSAFEAELLEPVLPCWPRAASVGAKDGGHCGPLLPGANHIG